MQHQHTPDVVSVGLPVGQGGQQGPGSWVGPPQHASNAVVLIGLKRTAGLLHLFPLRGMWGRGVDAQRGEFGEPILFSGSALHT